MENLIQKINNLIFSVRDDDAKSIIGKFVLNNLDFVIQTDIKTLAQKCHVAPSSIVRFCQVLDLEGFNELKFLLKQTKKTHFYEKSEFSFAPHYLKIKNEAAQYLDANFLEMSKFLVSYFTKKVKIHIFCFNVGFFATKNFVQRMRKRGFQIYLEDDPSSIQSYIDAIQSQDLSIFISLSGENKILENFARLLKQRNHTFAILGSEKGFVKYVDDFCVLKNQEDNFWELYSIRSQTLQQFWDYLYLEIK